MVVMFIWRHKSTSYLTMHMGKYTRFWYLLHHSEGSGQRACTFVQSLQSLHFSIIGNPGVNHSVPTAWWMQWVRNGSRLGYRECPFYKEWISSHWGSSLPECPAIALIGIAVSQSVTYILLSPAPALTKREDLLDISCMNTISRTVPSWNVSSASGPEGEYK